jgi:hypothetical protein
VLAPDVNHASRLRPVGFYQRTGLFLITWRTQASAKPLLTGAPRQVRHPVILRMALPGFPATSVSEATSFVTTEPAATTEFSPIVTPGITIAPRQFKRFLTNGTCSSHDDAKALADGQT